MLNNYILGEYGMNFTFSDKVNEMKSKLGLPMSASLQNIVDNMDMGGDAYLGLLPTNATITCVATGDCGIKITVAGDAQSLYNVNIAVSADGA